MTTKICTKCNCEKELELFLFSKKTNKYLSWCKDCNSKYKKENYIKNKVKISEKAKIYRKDNKEELAKRKKEYYNKNKSKVLEKNKLWRDSNKEKKAEMDKKYTEANKEHLSILQKKWKIENKEIISKKDKEYRILNKDRLNIIKNIYRNTEKGKIAKTNSEHKRRFLKKHSSDNTIPLYNKYYPTSKCLMEMLQQQNYKCIYCECEINHKLKNIHLDHIIPINKGGLHGILNVQWLCSSCNTFKSDKDPIEYANSMGRLL